MKTSIFVAASGALGALAGPLAKRVMETKYVTDIVCVTVTEGEPIPTMYMAGQHVYPTTSTPPPPPPPPPTYVPAPPPPPPVKTVAPVAPPPPPPPPPKYPVNVPSAPTDYPSTVTYHHNIHRDNHSAPAISWSDKYAGYAAQAAASCKFAHNLGPGGGGYGQNIAMYAASNAKGMGESKAAGQAITDMWYNSEVSKFPASDYGKPSPNMGNFHDWGHYSQVIWKGSTQVGCKTQYCPRGTMFSGMDAWYTVCNYFPAGNMGGAYGKNMSPPQGKAPVQV